MSLQLPLNIPDNVRQAADLVAALDRCFLSGFGRLGPEQHAALQALQRVCAGTPLDGPVQTAVSALQAGEIDFYEIPPIDLLPQLLADANLTVEIMSEMGNVGMLRMNHLHAPFSNVKLRQAMQYLLKQEDMLRPTFSDPKWFHSCGSLSRWVARRKRPTGVIRGSRFVAHCTPVFRSQLWIMVRIL